MSNLLTLMKIFTPVWNIFNISDWEIEILATPDDMYYNNTGGSDFDGFALVIE